MLQMGSTLELTVARLRPRGILGRFDGDLSPRQVANCKKRESRVIKRPRRQEGRPLTHVGAIELMGKKHTLDLRSSRERERGQYAALRGVSQSEAFE